MQTKLNTLKLILTATVLSLATIWLSATALADETSTAEQISHAVSDHTYQGSMTDSSFAEYYQADGTIKGKDYTGKWRTEDNVMCFQYGDSPEKCWEVKLDGAAMTLYKEGVVDGSGMLVSGNPHNF